MQDRNSELVIRLAELPEKEMASVTAKPRSQLRSKRAFGTKPAQASNLTCPTSQRSRSNAMRRRERLSLRVELEGRWLLVLAAGVAPALGVAIKIFFGI